MAFISPDQIGRGIAIPDRWLKSSNAAVCSPK